MHFSNVVCKDSITYHENAVQLPLTTEGIMTTNNKLTVFDFNLIF